MATAQGFDGFLLLLGRLNYTWTNTESLLIHRIAGLSGTDKEVAIIIFLTLNTTRARIDLVERLAKMPRVSENERDAVLDLTGRLQRLSGLRNHYNHCIYSFDIESGSTSTILMRVSDRRKRIKFGEMNPLGQDEIRGIEDSIGEIGRLNQKFWALIRERGYPA